MFCSFEDPELYMRRTERRKRGSFDFVKEGKLQKQAQIGRLRVRLRLWFMLRLQLWTNAPFEKPCTLAAGRLSRAILPPRLSRVALHAHPCPCGVSCRRSMATMQ